MTRREGNLLCLHMPQTSFCEEKGLPLMRIRDLYHIGMQGKDIELRLKD